tara:strand:- start:2045 stop:2551 length:507 start_codon:yes stop_codon:yes gene_type:complete
MDKELDHKHEKNYFLFLLNKHKTKIILFISIIILGIFLIIFLNILNEKKNSEISEQFLKAGILLSSNEKDESKKILEKIVLSKNKFYSKLALNILIEKNLIKEEKKVLNLFEIVEKVEKSKDQKDLIIFKKALFLIKNNNKSEGEKILNYLISSNSSIKSLAQDIIKN